MLDTDDGHMELFEKWVDHGDHSDGARVSSENASGQTTNHQINDWSEMTTRPCGKAPAHSTSGTVGAATTSAPRSASAPAGPPTPDQRRGNESALSSGPEVLRIDQARVVGRSGLPRP